VNVVVTRSIGRDWRPSQKQDCASTANEGATLSGRRRGFKAGWWVLPVVTILTLVVDQITKHIVVSNLAVYEYWAPIPALAKVFTVRYVTNTGAAFGLFQNGSWFFIIVAIVVSLVIVFYYRYLPDRQWLVRVSLGLQLAGALGNLIDRLRVGYVIDFLDFQVWPVFNVADMSIVCGVILLALLLLREDYQERKRPKSIGETERA
jgi:signal peptidase II